jgi:hypothetical protein
LRRATTCALAETFTMSVKAGVNPVALCAP